MLKISFSGTTNVSKELEAALTKAVKEVSESVYTAARANTPVKTGNARKNWTKTVKDKNFAVENRVPYIERLEAGSSKQAPRGIIMPTLTQVKGK